MHYGSPLTPLTPEMMTLKIFFIGNGFPGRLVDNCVRQFFNKIFRPAQRLTAVPRDIHYVSLPYLGPPSVKLVKYLKNVLQRYYHQVEFKFSLSNSFKIKSFFNYKDHLPLDLRSGIVYKI